MHLNIGKVGGALPEISSTALHPLCTAHTNRNILGFARRNAALNNTTGSVVASVGIWPPVGHPPTTLKY